MHTSSMKYMRPAVVAKKLGMTEGALANLRSKGAGPRWVKIGGKVMYEGDVVSVYLSRHANSGFWTNKTPVVLGWKAPGSGGDA